MESRGAEGDHLTADTHCLQFGFGLGFRVRLWLRFGLGLRLHGDSHVAPRREHAECLGIGFVVQVEGVVDRPGRSEELVGDAVDDFIRVDVIVAVEERADAVLDHEIVDRGSPAGPLDRLVLTIGVVGTPRAYPGPPAELGTSGCAPVT